MMSFKRQTCLLLFFSALKGNNLYYMGGFFMFGLLQIRMKNYYLSCQQTNLLCCVTLFEAGDL